MQRRYNSSYVVTNAAIDVATLIWSADLQGAGVSCNIILLDGIIDTDGTRRSTCQRKKFNVDVINDALLWLSLPASDWHIGERYAGARWNSSLASAKAALGVLEAPALRSLL